MRPGGGTLLSEVRRAFLTASVAAKWVVDVETSDGRLLSKESRRS